MAHHHKHHQEQESTKKKHHHHHHSHSKKAQEGQQKERETAVEKPITTRHRSGAVGPKDRPNLEVISNPEWYVGMKERLNEFGQYSDAFAGTKENLIYTADVGHLSDMEGAAEIKKQHLDALFSTIQNYHEQMEQDPGNEDKKAEGAEFYEICCSKMKACEKHYENLMTAIAERKQTVENETKQMKKVSNLRQTLVNEKKDSPMMMLIRRIKAMESGAKPDSSGVKTTKTAEFMDLFSEQEQEAIDTLGGVKEEYEEVKEGGENVKDFIEGVKNGVVNDKEDTLKDKIGSAVEIVKGIADTVRNSVDMIRNFSKMSDDNKAEGLVSLITSGMKTALEAGKFITELLKEVPILGGIIGIIKNVITFFHKGFEIYKSKKREKELRVARRSLREKMLKRQKKYASDKDLKDMNLYSQVEQRKDGTVRMTKAGKSERRETRGLDGTAGGSNRQIMQIFSGARKGDENPAAKKAYYKAKASETQAQYDEMKEAAYRNKNITREAVLDIVQEGIDLVGNIASFVPGVGTVVKAGASMTNSGTSMGRKAVSKASRGYKNHTGSLRSDERKAQFRAKYAENIYASLADVARFVNAEGSIEIGDSGADQVKRVEDAYQFAKTLLNGVGADMPALINSESKEELLQNMSSMFAREG